MQNQPTKSVTTRTSSGSGGEGGEGAGHKIAQQEVTASDLRKNETRAKQIEERKEIQKQAREEVGRSVAAEEIDSVKNVQGAGAALDQMKNKTLPSMDGEQINAIEQKLRSFNDQLPTDSDAKFSDAEILQSAVNVFSRRLVDSDHIDAALEQNGLVGRRGVVWDAKIKTIQTDLASQGIDLNTVDKHDIEAQAATELIAEQVRTKQRQTETAQTDQSTPVAESSAPAPETTTAPGALSEKARNDVAKNVKDLMGISDPEVQVLQTRLQEAAVAAESVKVAKRFSELMDLTELALADKISAIQLKLEGESGKQLSGTEAKALNTELEELQRIQSFRRDLTEGQGEEEAAASLNKARGDAKEQVAHANLQYDQKRGALLELTKESETSKAIRGAAKYISEDLISGLNAIGDNEWLASLILKIPEEDLKGAFLRGLAGTPLNPLWAMILEFLKQALTVPH